MKQIKKNKLNLEKIKQGININKEIRIRREHTKKEINK